MIDGQLFRFNAPGENRDVLLDAVDLLHKELGMCGTLAAHEKSLGADDAGLPAKGGGRGPPVNNARDGR